MRRLTSFASPAFPRASNMPCDLRFIAGDSNDTDQPPSKTAVSKAWQRCQQSLDVPPADRTEVQLEKIIQYSKGVQFFKYITNNQRYDLCKNMMYTTMVKNQLVMHGGTNPEVFFNCPKVAPCGATAPTRCKA